MCLFLNICHNLNGSSALNILDLNLTHLECIWEGIKLTAYQRFLIYFCYFVYVFLHFLVLFMSLIVLFNYFCTIQLVFSFFLTIIYVHHQCSTPPLVITSSSCLKQPSTMVATLQSFQLGDPLPCGQLVNLPCMMLFAPISKPLD